MAALEEVEIVPAVQLLRTFANNCGVTVVGGSVLLAAGNTVTNTCLVLGPHGTLLARYDKVHLFDIALDEDHSFQGTRYVAPGRDPATFSAFGWRMGLSKCYYLRFPEPYRELVMRGAEVLFVPSALTWRTGMYR